MASSPPSTAPSTSACSSTSRSAASIFSANSDRRSSSLSPEDSASNISGDDEHLQTSYEAVNQQFIVLTAANASDISRTQAWLDAGHATGEPDLSAPASTPVQVRLAIEAAYQATLDRAGYPSIAKALWKTEAYDHVFSLMARDVKAAKNAISNLFFKKKAKPFALQEIATHAEKPPAYERRSCRIPYSAKTTKLDMHEAAVVAMPAQTLLYEGSTAGGKARKQAEEEGQGQAFEDSVQAMLASLGPCSSKSRWYNTKLGYLCAGGNHLVYHRQIDDWAAEPKTVRPRVALVNTFNTPYAPISPYIGLIGNWDGHPPNVDLWQPMHARHQAYMQKARLAGMLSFNHERCECDEIMGTPHLSHGEQRFLGACIEHAMKGPPAGPYEFGDGQGPNH